MSSITRTKVFTLCAGACVLLFALASVYLGARSFSFSDVTAIVLSGPGAVPESSTLSPQDHGIIWELRVPRTLLALVVGASLSVAGAVAQSWTRNPLADPGIIGVNAGAGFAVAVALTVGMANSVGERALWGIAGAAVASAVVLAVSRVSRDPLTLVLVGVGVTFALQAATNLLSLYSSDTLEGLRRWTVGSTAGRSMGDVALAAAGCAVGCVIAVIVARSLDVLAMGEETAKGLGTSPERTRILAALAVIVLAGTATATVGLVTFVGFAVPHVVRRFTGPALNRMLLPTALAGAGTVLLADIVGRFVLQPNELEMAIVLGVLGAPLMIAAVSSPRRSRALLQEEMPV